MASDKPVLICAHLAGKKTLRWKQCSCLLLLAIEVVGDLTTTENSDTRSDHFVIVSVDEKKVAKSVKKPSMPSPR